MAKKILIADDDPQIIRILGLHLRAGGYEVIVAYDAMQAFAQALREKPDLVIMDIQMPAGGGMSALGKLQTSAKTAAIPVIVLTGVPGGQVKQTVLRLGAIDFIPKPFKAADVLAIVKRALGEEAPASDASADQRAEPAHG